MLLDLHRMAESKAGASGGLRLARWNDRYFEPCAKLIYLSYANHVDGEINDQYRSESGAMKFLKNIIILPGCGQFQAHASFVLRAPHSQELMGVVLTSAVAPRRAATDGSAVSSDNHHARSGPIPRSARTSCGYHANVMCPGSAWRRPVPM